MRIYVVYRRYGSVKWPGMANKSIAGSVAFALGSFLATTAMLQWMSYTGCMTVDISSHILDILLISIVCAAVELLPVIDDNISVPVTAALLTLWLF